MAHPGHAERCVQRSSLKTGPARSGKIRPGFLKILQQLMHMNLSNYFFRADSTVFICIMQPVASFPQETGASFLHEILMQVSSTVT